MQSWRKKIFTLMVCNLLVWIAAAHLSGGLAAQEAARAQSGQQAQVEKGREVVGQVCVACHTNILRMVQVHRQTPEQWKDTVYSMIGRGAQVMPDEVEAVAAFLAANAGGNGQPTTRASNAGRPARDDQQMPEGEGKAILQRTCQQCHDLATASTKQATEEWSAVIAKMMTYGAKLTPADQQKLIAYLNGLAK
jgi:mono/diheme cytochrome c family protein